jgi:hypothetical protein
MIRIIVEIPDQEDATEDTYLEVSRYYQDLLEGSAFNHRFQSELITDSHREVAQ